MYRISLILSFLCLSSAIFAQEITPAKGVGEVQIGKTYNQIINVLGFEGKKTTYQEYLDEMGDLQTEKFLETFIGFDYSITYGHVMTLPISVLYFKNDILVGMILSSYPDYFFDICEDMPTVDGLYFWDDENKMKATYGSAVTLVKIHNVKNSNFFYLEKGIGFGVEKHIIRAIQIFTPLAPKDALKYTSIAGK